MLFFDQFSVKTDFFEVEFSKSDLVSSSQNFATFLSKTHKDIKESYFCRF